jgi:hypothetical protein
MTPPLAFLRLAALAALACAVALPVLGCVDADDRFDITAPPLSQFPPVGAMFVHRCGSLDCHGQTGRNLRIYGREGLRLSSKDIPGGDPTTTAEYDADYRSAVALEPEIMSQVVEDGGEDPSRLTLVRKPRGEESHKGGTLIHVGDPQDICLTSWLAGTTDTSSCGAALEFP